LSNNNESIDLFKIHGFVEIGRKKDWILTDNGYLDEFIFQLLNE
jgi:diamine N-acetyltransferase